jgi:Ca-activated chloride channel family protein
MLLFKPLPGAALLLLLMISCNNNPDAGKSGRYEISPDPIKSSPPAMTDSALPGEQQTASNTEDYDHIVENSFLKAKEQPLSTFSIDVDDAAYSNVRRFIQDGSLPPAGAVRVEEMINYFDYNYATPQNDDPFAVTTETGACPWNEQHRLVHIGIKGKEISKEKLPASNIVFLVDVSGSMSDANKLPLLKKSLRMLTKQLRSEDRVALVVYAGAAGLVLPSTRGSDKTTIIEAIDNLEAGGSTAGAAGIQLAYETARKSFIPGGNNRVILATDGDFNVGPSSDDELVTLVEKERKSNIFLTVLGFGMGNYKDNKMQQLADKGNGNHAYIDNINEAQKILVNEFSSTLFTIAKDVKLQVEFNPAKVQAYRLIGYENRMLQQQDFNDDKKDAGEIGAGHTVTALYEIIPVGVKDSFTVRVDDLKYQHPSEPMPSFNNELMNIKIRYKTPEGNTSKLIARTVSSDMEKPENSSDNFRFSAAVAGFGMLLRNSEYKQNTTYAKVLSLANSAIGEDPFGYRAEFISLVKSAKNLAN